MIVVGSTAQWRDLISPMVPEILELVVSTWASMPALAADTREDPTTEALCRLLRQNRSASSLPFRIDYQFVELDPAADQNQGRIDIIFSPMLPREDVYFALECKRLNARIGGTLRTLAAEYVTHGMLRFVRGQYAFSVRHAGMLAYVLDGQVQDAITSVQGAVRARHVELAMAPPGQMAASTVRPADNYARETTHTRQQDAFAIHHLFVG